MAALLLCLCLQAEPPQPVQAPSDSTATSWLDKLHGRLSIEVRNRWNQDDSDADLFELLHLTWGDREKDAITAVVSARFAEDLDGERNTTGFFAFDSLDDSYRHGSTARLLTAVVDWREPLPDVNLRAGRQWLEELPESVPMDGLSASFDLDPSVTAGAYAGVPVNLFESSHSGDAMGGVWAAATPWTGGRARFDWLHLEDENLFGRFKDDLVALSLDHVEGRLRTHARYTNLEGGSRDGLIRVSADFAEQRLLAEAQVTYVFKTLQAFSFPLDPYSILLVELKPYVQATLRASKRFGERLGIDGSLTARQLTDDSDETAYNHEFVHASLAPRAYLENLSFGATADFWQSTDDDFWTVGGDATWTAHPRLALSAGTAFALYTVDAFTGEERERVRMLWLSLRWKVPEAGTLDARLSIERNEFDTFGSFEIGVRRDF